MSFILIPGRVALREKALHGGPVHAVMMLAMVWAVAVMSQAAHAGHRVGKADTWLKQPLFVSFSEFPRAVACEECRD